MAGLRDGRRGGVTSLAVASVQPSQLMQQAVILRPFLTCATRRSGAASAAGAGAGFLGSGATAAGGAGSGAAIAAGVAREMSL
jgi:hypothetical protein